MSVTAKLRFLQVSPFKVRKYAQLFKGKSIEEARAVLAYHPSPTCASLLKLLNSAVANAENNREYDPQLLFVRNVIVDGAATQKRLKTRARGRGNRILKRTSHVTIEVDLKDKFKVKAAAEPQEKEKPKSVLRRKKARIPVAKKAAVPAEDKEKPVRKPSRRKSVVKEKPSAAAAAKAAKKEAAVEPSLESPRVEPKEAEEERDE